MKDNFEYVIHWTGGITLASLVVLIIFLLCQNDHSTKVEAGKTHREAIHACGTIKDEALRTLCIQKNNN